MPSIVSMFPDLCTLRFCTSRYETAFSWVQKVPNEEPQNSPPGIPTGENSN